MPQYEAYSSLLDICPRQEPATSNFDSSSFVQSQVTSDSATTAAPLHTYSPEPCLSTTTHSSSSRASGSESPADEKDCSSVPQRSESIPSSNGKDNKEKVEKRKRSRVTPEQLVHLERFFLLDRSPTAVRRKEISELLGMQERQTQIWFQNRRAKAKLQDVKHKGRGASIEAPPPNTPPQLSTGFQVDLHNLIHEDEPVTIIPCTDLTVGTWRRIATSLTRHDLVAYVCDSKRCLTWFIHSVGFGFKMEIPFEFIVDTEFTNAAPGSGLASFILSEPPLFYLENLGPSLANGTPVRHWKRCSDWTEGQQASRVLRHDLIGSAVQLSHLIRNLRTAPRHSLSYSSEQSAPPMTTMELPPPPLANLKGPGYHYQRQQHIDDASYQSSVFQKSSPYASSGLTTPSPESPYSNDSDQPPPFNPAAPAPFTQHQSHHNMPHPRSDSLGVEGGSAYAHYPPVDAHHDIGPRSHSVDGYIDAANSHGVLPRPYSAQSIPRSYYNDPPSRSIQSYQTGDISLRRANAPSSAATMHAAHPRVHSHQQQFASPSPPLLTTSYHPPPNLLHRSRDT